MQTRPSKQKKIDDEESDKKDKEKSN